MATAEDIHVTAKVSAPLPTGPATITSPADGQRFSAVPITVTGSCPSDGSGEYVKLFRNDVFSGVALCDASQNFSLSSDLFPGANVLKATIFNRTDDAGPDSATMTVFYDVPPAPTGTPVSSPQSPLMPPFILNTDFRYTGYYVGQTVKWQLTVNGGQPPYAFNVDWDDGTTTLISRTQAGTFDISHVYNKQGGYKGSYTIRIRGSDAAGDQTSLQLFVLVNQSNVGPIAGTTVKPPPLSSTQGWLKWVWPAYAILVLMGASFYLGEKEELLVLKGRRPTRRRHA